MRNDDFTASLELSSFGSSVLDGCVKKLFVDGNGVVSCERKTPDVMTSQKRESLHLPQLFESPSSPQVNETERTSGTYMYTVTIFTHVMSIIYRKEYVHV